VQFVKALLEEKYFSHWQRIISGFFTLKNYLDISELIVQQVEKIMFLN
jgi:hypothetical protein